MSDRPARIPADLIPAPFDVTDLDRLYDEQERSQLDRVPAEPDADRFPALRWQIQDRQGAEWAMRHLAYYTDKAAQVKADADEWRAQATTWEQDQLRQLAHHQQFFQGHLERWGLTQREAGEGATVALPSGKVATRQAPARLEISDPDAVLDWCEGLDLDAYHLAVKLTPQLAGVQKLATIVEVPTAAEVVLTCCGTVQLLVGQDLTGSVPELLSVWDGPCGECGHVDAGVAQVTVVQSRWEARYDGAAIPGTRVIPPTVTASTKPAGR